jgi:hypothetical protein
VEIVYGSNIPLLSRTLQNQLEIEELYEAGEFKKSREFYDFDEPLPFEMDEIERRRAEEEVIIKNDNVSCILMSSFNFATLIKGQIIS